MLESDGKNTAAGIKLSNARQLDWNKMDGLIPAIVQDAFDGRVLMQAYMNKAALEQTLTTGLVTLEDVIETLLGMEIVDEADKVEDMQALARQKWSTRAKALGLEVDLPKLNTEEAIKKIDSNTKSKDIETNN